MLSRKMAATLMGAGALIAGCGNGVVSTPAAPPSRSADADAQCATSGSPLAASVSPEARLVGAVRTSVQRLIHWQQTRFAEGQGPDLADAALADQPPGSFVYVCIYDGDFGELRNPPPGMAPVTSNRMVVLVDTAGNARIELTTTQDKLSADGPPPA